MKQLPADSIDLSNITCWCYDSNHPKKGLNVVRHMNDLCTFGDSIFVSSQDISVPDNVRFFKLPIGGIAGSLEGQIWGHKELIKELKTDYAMFVHYDGFILHPEKWSPDFLNYDYIGAPWHYNYRNRVGNGGFTLMSRKFIEVRSRLEWNPYGKGYPDNADDYYFCERMYDHMLREGIKYAPLEVASRFSLEWQIPEYPMTYDDVFGFHGSPNYGFKTEQYINAVQEKYNNAV